MLPLIFNPGIDCTKVEAISSTAPSLHYFEHLKAHYPWLTYSRGRWENKYPCLSVLKSLRNEYWKLFPVWCFSHAWRKNICSFRSLCSVLQLMKGHPRQSLNRTNWFFSGRFKWTCVYFFLHFCLWVIRQNYSHALECTVAEWLKDATECPCGHWASGRNSGSYRE